jgi:hypothetical protein
LKPRNRSALPAGRRPDDLAAALGPGFGAGGNVHAGFAEAVILDFARLKAAHQPGRPARLSPDRAAG